MTNLDFLKTKTIDEISETINDGDNTLSEKIWLEDFDDSEECFKVDCEYLETYYDQECPDFYGMCKAYGRECPHSIDRKEIRKELIKDWLNKEFSISSF